jgi:hypothetical protein
VAVGVVGWWITWPAEPVNGTVVSYHAVRGQHARKGSLYEDLPHQTHPPELIEELRPTILPSLEEGRDLVEEIVEGHLSPEDPALWEKRSFVAAWAFGADAIFSAAAAHVLPTHQPRFFATYFSSVDVASHNYCSGYAWPAATCGRAVDQAYAFVDHRIGNILAHADEDTTIIVVSDHGFDRKLDHRGFFPPGPDGILIIAGPSVRAGARIEGASVYDLAPTILALFGHEIPRDLRGRPLLSAFEDDFVSRWEIESGPSLDPRLDPDDPSVRAIPAVNESDFKDRLRALGYID